MEATDIEGAVRLTAHSDAGKPPGRLRAILREPLLHFFIAGLILFLAAQAWRATHDQRVIIVTAERAAELAGKYRLQFGQAATAAQMDGIVAAYVQEEALYREGRAMGLDRDDEIVRRRIAQKVEFLQQDRGLPAEPTAGDLKRFFTGHLADYATPVRTSFSHLYFTADAGRDGEARAGRALAALGAGAAADSVGAEPFPDLNAYAAVSREQAARLFGDSDLARRLDAAPAGRWSGPYRSGYGWHLMRVEARTPAGRPALADVRDKVREDYLRAAQGEANARALDRLRARYTVVRQDKAAR